MAVFFTRRGAPPSLGKKLSDYAEGDMIKIPENGTPVEFYVAKHNYESTLNGLGRVLIVRKNIYDNGEWDRGNINAYASSDIDAWFNSTYKNMLDANIRSLIGTTKIRYTPGNGNNTVSILERSIFALSLTELGVSATYSNVEGSLLPIAGTLKIAYLNNSASEQYTRSPSTDNIRRAYAVGTYGSALGYFCYFTNGYRPTFTLPSTTKFDPDTNVIIG